MSAGNVHIRASLLLAAGFSAGALISQNTGLLECVAGSLAGIMISPDLDVDAGNVSNTIIKKKIGWFGERLWRWFWRPYASSFKHGQFASHCPIFGTLVRLAYIYFWTVLPVEITYFLILRLLNYHLDLRYEFMYWIRIIFSPMFVYGLVSSDTIHYFLDLLTKEKAR